MDYQEEIYKLLQNNQIQFWSLIATLVTTLLWGVYVYFTIKTFNQIKKQTDLQSRAFLLATPKVSSEIQSVKIDSKAIELKDKWHRILENNLPTSINENRIFELELTNRGKSDIISWEIDLVARIDEGMYLNEKFGIYGETTDWIIKSNSEQTIAPNQTIKVPIILVGDFPKVFINWTISYSDLMEGKYKTNQNGNGYTISNLIAFNYKE
jgi:Ca2+/Na+ antiporter